MSTKAQLEKEIERLTKEKEYYRKESLRLDGILTEKNVISMDDYGKMVSERDYWQGEATRMIASHEKTMKRERQRYDALMNEFRELEERVEKDVRKHNERGAGRKTMLTPEKVKEIKRQRLEGATFAEIAESEKVSVGFAHKAFHS